MAIIKGNEGESLYVSRMVFKYMSTAGLAYFFDVETINSSTSNFVFRAKTMRYNEDYLKRYAGENMRFVEHDNEQTGEKQVDVEYVNDCYSDISKEETLAVLDRVYALCAEGNIALEIV